MGLEHRDGRVYYYRSRRIGGRVRREYVGAGESAVMFARWDEVDRDQRDFDAWDKAERQREADEILAAGAEADRLTDRVFRAVMHLTGHTLHKRTEWRRTRGVKAMATIHETGTPPRNTTISGKALPPLEAEAQEIIAKAGRSAPMLLAFRELVKNPTAIESID